MPGSNRQVVLSNSSEQCIVYNRPILYRSKFVPKIRDIRNRRYRCAGHIYNRCYTPAGSSSRTAQKIFPVSKTRIIEMHMSIYAPRDKQFSCKIDDFRNPYIEWVFGYLLNLLIEQDIDLLCSGFPIRYLCALNQFHNSFYDDVFDVHNIMI